MMMTCRLVFLLVSLAAVPSWADPTPSGLLKKYGKGVVSWSRPVGGLALLLAPGTPPLVEGRDPSTNAAAHLVCKLLIKNVSKKTLTFQRRVFAAFQVHWQMVDSAGNRWVPTFLPTPMPRPGMKYKTHRLAPGEAAVLAQLHGISGFRRAGKADGRWYGVPPAGTYKVTVSGVHVGNTKRMLASGPARIRVLPADRPVKGLKLRLSAASATTRRTRKGAGAQPVKLTLTFTNVGKKTITLDVHRMGLDLLQPHVRGNLSHSEVRRRAPPPRRAGQGLVKLGPGKTHVHTRGLQAPGPLGKRRYRYSGLGWYQLRLEYARRAPPLSGCWTGSLSSNVVWLKVTK